MGRDYALNPDSHPLQFFSPQKTNNMKDEMDIEMLFLTQEEYDSIDKADCKVRKAKFVCGTPCAVARNDEFFLIKVPINGEKTKGIWRRMALIGSGTSVEVRYTEVKGKDKVAQFISYDENKLHSVENDGIILFRPFDSDVYMEVNEAIGETTAEEFFNEITDQILTNYLLNTTSLGDSDAS